MDFYLGIKCQNVNSWIHFPLLPYTQVGDNVTTKIFGLIRTERKYSLWTGFFVSSVNGIHEKAANKLLNILLNNLSAVEDYLAKGMGICYVIWILFIHLAVTGTISIEICASSSLIVDQARATSIRQRQIKFTDLSLVGPNVETPRSTPNNEESLLSRPV